MEEDKRANNPAVPPEWLTIEQAADWLQVSTKTIRRYIEAGSLPAINLGGRAIRIRRQELEAWLQNRRIEPGVSLRHLERQERHEQRRQEHSRNVRASRPVRVEDLGEVNVTIAQQDSLILRCNTCGATWSPQVHSNGKLARRAWCCPQGCNCR